MNKGWIKLHRCIQDCTIWNDNQPFDKRSAWIDLIMLANHSDKEILFNNELIIVKRGQYLTSVRKLSERWSWSKDRTLKFLRLLETLGMIRRDKDNTRTLLTIENYGIYQSDQDTDKDTDKDTNKDTDKDTTSPQTRIKELKNVKNENNTYIVGLEEVQEIIDHLNEKTGKNFSAKSDKTRRLINTRFKEGYTVADFKKVIDVKSQEWGSSNTMKQYLRPETLFGTKFEGYLNQEGSDNDERSSGTDEAVYTEEQFAALRACGYGLL